MHNNNIAKALVLAAMTAAVPFAAHAADLPSAKEPLAPAPVADTFQPLFVKLGFTYAINQSSSHLYAFGTDLGIGATVSNVATLGFEAGLFVTKNISIDVSGGVPLRASDKTKGTSPFALAPGSGTVLTNIVPAIVPLTVVYHFDNFGAFRPYVGAGFGPSFSFNNSNAYLTNVKLAGTVDTVVQFGVDYMLNQSWGLSFDAKKAFSYSEGHGIATLPVFGATNVVQHVHFDPWLLSVGLLYRFGAPSAAAVVAKY